MSTTATRTRKATTAPAPRTGRTFPALGHEGHRVMTVGGVPAEVHSTDIHDGDERVTMVIFDVPGEDVRAIVSIALLDGTRWQIGLDGWQHDEYPTIHDAVAAVVNPTTRRQIRERTAYVQELRDLERKARSMRENIPAAPAGALERLYY